MKQHAHIKKLVLPIVIAGAAFCAIPSCVTDQAARYYSSEKYPAKASNEVEILYTKPSREYVVIADFQARNTNANYMQREAAKIGADAVIVSYLGGNRDRADVWAGTDSQSRTFSRITGTAIRYH